MTWILRPSTPPWALMSSAAISAALVSEAPATADSSPMTPILIGSFVCAEAQTVLPSTIAAAASTAGRMSGNELCGCCSMARLLADWLCRQTPNARIGSDGPNHRSEFMAGNSIHLLASLGSSRAIQSSTEPFSTSMKIPGAASARAKCERRSAKRSATMPCARHGGAWSSRRRRRAHRADRLRLAGDGPVAYFEFPFDGGFTAGPLLFPGSPLILDASWSRVSGFCGSLTVVPGVLVPDPGGCTAGPLLLPGLPAMPAPESWALGVVISAGFFAGLVCAQAGSAVTTTTATAAPKSLVMVYSWKTESVGPAAPCHGRSARPGNVAAEA